MKLIGRCGAHLSARLASLRLTQRPLAWPPPPSSRPSCPLLPLVKAGRVPKLPRDRDVLPWDAARAAVAQQHASLPALPRPLYDYWLKRRREEGGPLLQHLWYEQPWKVRGKGGGH